MKNWPTWLKRLGIASLVIAALDILLFLLVWIPCFTRGCDGLGEFVFTAILLLPIFSILIVFWGFVFILFHFYNNRKWFNVALVTSACVAAVVLIGILGYFSFSILFHPKVERQPTPAQPTNIGILQGKVTQSPICPVETMPPDPACAPKGYATDILVSGGSLTTPKLISTDAEGYFTALLLPGTYLLSVGGENKFPKCEATQVEINLQQTSNVNISCDTGIR
ncbi:MAG: carboxypeptidase-like regulatory domain-containing protein [bacterium]|nr:carboxypeptidase-like regulatory domain-containing protein [bacterium]